jgi:hypothetical protein
MVQQGAGNRDDVMDGGRSLDGIPSLQDIFSKKCSTKDYVPKEARRVWSQCLTQALADVIEHNDQLAWAQLFMLPKAVLRSAQRGGKRKAKNAGTQTLLLCRRWLEGQREVLWH